LGLSPNWSDSTGEAGAPDRPVGPCCWLAGPPGPRAEGRGKQASRADGWVSAHSAGFKRKSFLFSKSFYNLQTNLNAIKIRILTTSTRKNKI
jgi:hypothetical protein